MMQPTDPPRPQQAPAPPRLSYAPPQGPLSVLLEDALFVLLDKPAGLLSVPGKSADLADCLEARAQLVWPDALTVHRLDLATSGVCVLARGAEARRHLSMQFARRHVTKTYTAVVRGHVWGQTGQIALPLCADWPRRPRQMVSPAQGRAALTGWQVTARGDGTTRLALTPLTGRSHQLRAHLLALGHPILGDPIYGDAQAAPRMLLHATELTFRHPADGTPVSSRAPCPF